MLGLQHRIIVQHLEHLEAVGDPDVERVDFERLVEQLVGFGFAAQAHVHHAQRTVRLDELRHAFDRQLEACRRMRVLAHQIKGGAGRTIELPAMRIELLDLGH